MWAPSGSAATAPPMAVIVAASVAKASLPVISFAARLVAAKVAVMPMPAGNTEKIRTQRVRFRMETTSVSGRVSVI